MEDENFVPSGGENMENEIANDVGMQFPDDKQVYDFYVKYAYAAGFPVRRRSSSKDDDGILRYVTFTCSREGRKHSSTGTCMKPQPISNTGCKARISASLDIHGYWKINNRSSNRVYRKGYCDLTSTVDENTGTRYEVCEDVFCGGKRKKKNISGMYRGILCRHAITVIIRNDVTVVPDRCIL
ncbi:FAR1-related sequence 2 [Striga asiatica]|uniref:FAR1-related sequence 2 n=1 Tax=Striga asiatica TaxID=4170 RepID=A0A5A7PTU9_STRAF|nr:FAR1-related sequence 2 [Striga asiatica]